MKNKSARLEKRNFRKCVFGYACMMADEGETDGDYGEFSIIIYKNGILEYREYLFDEVLKNEKLYMIPERIVKELIGLLESNKQMIKGLNEYTNNGSCDGSLNYFIFYKKLVSAFNIDYCEEGLVTDDICQYPPNYLECIKQENLILSLFDKICSILKKIDINLTLESVKFNENLLKL